MLAIILALYAEAVLYIKKYGLNLIPSEDIEAKEIIYFLQNDPLWDSEKIGETNNTLGSKGCLISVTASAICSLGEDTTPLKLGSALAEIGGFEGSDMIWYKINEAYPQIDYSYTRIFSSGRIENDLKEGRLPIVNVRYGGSGITHWVLIIGARNGEFLIYDPLNGDKTPLPLSSTHGRVYAYRVLIPAK